jgi:hypothetical protein
MMMIMIIMADAQLFLEQKNSLHNKALNNDRHASISNNINHDNQSIQVPNECLLDRWLWAGRVDFVETLQPTCIRKLRLRRPEPCPQISFNRNWRLNTSLCYSSGGKEPHAQPHAQPPSIAGETVHEAAMQQRQLIRHRRQRVAATQSTISEYRKKKNEAEEHGQFAWAVA